MTPASARSTNPLTRVKPQRVLFLQNTSIFESYGGVEYYLDDFITLAGKIFGAENVLSVVRMTGEPRVQRPYPTKWVPRASGKIARKLGNRFSWRFFQAAAREIKRFQPTLLFNTHVHLGPLAYALHRKFKIPFVSCVYGIEAWGDLWPQDEWVLKSSSAISSISYWTRKVLVERGYPADKISVVHPRLPAHLEPLPIPQYEDKNGRFTLLTISRLSAEEQYKGQDHVLKALDLLRHKHPGFRCRYIVMGEGNDRPRLEKMAAEMGLSKVVEFRDAVRERSELEKTYRESDLFIMPSRFGRWENRWRGEGFGIVFVEAAAFGVPSIAYDCGGVTDIITSEKDGLLVKPDDVEALADAIYQMGMSPEKRHKLGAEAYRSVMSRFTESPIQAEMIRFFNSL